jgi:hypothetical protein
MSNIVVIQSLFIVLKLLTNFTTSITSRTSCHSRPFVYTSATTRATTFCSWSPYFPVITVRKITRYGLPISISVRNLHFCGSFALRTCFNIIDYSAPSSITIRATPFFCDTNFSASLAFRAFYFLLCKQSDRTNSQYHSQYYLSHNCFVLLYPIRLIGFVRLNLYVLAKYSFSLIA